MDRLTECVGYHNDKPIYKTKIDMRKIGAVDILKNKLGAYEDAEENNLLYKFPCKVGTIVYFVGFNAVKSKRPMKCVVDGFEVDASGCYAVLNGVSSSMLHRFKAVNTKDFGETVFLTEEKAEIKLRELKGE